MIAHDSSGKNATDFKEGKVKRLFIQRRNGKLQSASVSHLKYYLSKKKKNAPPSLCITAYSPICCGCLQST